MEQRPLRLGDVVDDYCPRERRVTSHAIVAIVEDVIRQTRCTACDAEHPFKGGREPRLRKKPGAGLYDQVLADVAPGSQPSGGPSESGEGALSAGGAEPASGAAEAERAAEGADETPADERTADGWPAHRQLIRATLPRTESDPPTPRPIPEFTMHQRPARGGRGFRHFGNVNGSGSGNGEINGNGPGPGRPGPGHHGKHSGRRHRGSRRPR